ncbi:conjugal transfer protein TrbC [Salmonella enterica subsp. enterica serovar Infantis]|nr:conjugal transfer protein TrbC [Salmonella enterica subsp. enterica serovar Infantis]EGI5922758.1 conjugal transfer protein TrbC [Salmonella enterica subsp. enterica serovar Colindale]
MFRKPTPIQRQFVTRQTHHSALTEALLQPWIVMGSNASLLVLGIIFPVTIIPSLAFLTWQITSFTDQRFRLPLRIPMDVGGKDLSTERERREKLPFLPFTRRKWVSEDAGGTLCLGHARGKELGRELWLSTSDALRHMQIMATTGGGKTETLYSLYLNALCWGRGCCISDGKAQVDLATSTWSLARRFGREDDYYLLNFINGSRDKFRMLLDNDKRRAQTNSTNPFAHGTATFILQLLESLLPVGNGSDEGWKDKARAMMNALIYALCYKRARDNMLLSQDVIQSYLPLRRFAELYKEARQNNWHEEGYKPLENYLSTLAGFDMALIDKPSEWSSGVFDQHGFLIQQFARMLGMFNDVYGHVFPKRGGDIDMQDVLHNDRLLAVLIPALELSDNEAATLGKLYISDLRMNIAQALGSQVEGTPEHTLITKKFAGRFPFPILCDEVGYYFAQGLDKLAAQLRSLMFMLVLLGQDAQAMIRRSGGEFDSVNANQGTKLYLKTEDTKETTANIKAAAGKGFYSEQESMERSGGILEPKYEDTNQLQIRERDNVELAELKALGPGEGILVFEDNVVRTSSIHIPNEEKISRLPLRLNRFVPMRKPEAEDLYQQIPALAQRRPVQEAKVRFILDKMLREGELSTQLLDAPLYAMANLALDLDTRTDVTYTPTERGILLFSAVSDALRDADDIRINQEPPLITVTRKQLEAVVPCPVVPPLPPAEQCEQPPVATQPTNVAHEYNGDIDDIPDQPPEEAYDYSNYVEFENGDIPEESDEYAYSEGIKK